jgi:Protein of unknown function (DUF3563)
MPLVRPRPTAHSQLILRPYDASHRRAALQFDTGHHARHNRCAEREHWFAARRTKRWEHIMFEKLAKTLSSLLTDPHDRQRDAFLGASVDFVDLENRLRMLEMNHQPFTFYTNSTPRHRTY